MRILVINPNTTASMTADIERVARRAARPTTEVVCVNPPFGPRSIESHLEEAIAAAATLEVIAREHMNFDAIVIACFGDPGLAAAREIADVPVIGIAEAAMHLSCFVGHRFSVVSVLPRVIPMLHDLVGRYGLHDRCASIRTTGLSVLEIEQDWERAERVMIEEARAAVEFDGAEAICLGCAGMGPLQERMQAQIDVPIVDGTSAAIKVAESLHDLGLRTAKVRAFLHPGVKEYQGTEFPSIQRVSDPVPSA